MPIYVGSHKIADTGTHGIYVGSRAINAVYVGSRRVYQYLPDAQTFNASSSFQTYTVPKGCTKLTIDCVGAKGKDYRATGGNGGRVQCTLSVTPNQTLYIYVGSNSAEYNASDIRTNNTGITNTTSLQSRLVVAGGGGCGGNANGTNGNGGAGGGLVGAQGANANGCVGGWGGTQTAGGAKGYGTAAVPYDGVDGSFGLGGEPLASGGGGAGWYGGGSGGAHSYYSNDHAGGGGGSSYTNSTYCSNVTHTQGYRNGAGYITITPTK